MTLNGVMAVTLPYSTWVPYGIAPQGPGLLVRLLKGFYGLEDTEAQKGTTWVDMGFRPNIVPVLVSHTKYLVSLTPKTVLKQ